MVRKSKFLITLSLIFGVFSFVNTNHNDARVAVAAVDAANVETYYASLYDNSGNILYKGNELLTRLNQIISTDTKNGSYEDLEDIYKTSDVDPSDPSKVILYYTGESVKWDFETYYANKDSLYVVNREHIWCRSHYGCTSEKPGDSQLTPNTDAHHVRPIHHAVNSARNNRYYEELQGNINDKGYLVSGGLFMPIDSYKGDTARICFYVATRYSNLSFVDGAVTGESSGTPNYEMGNLSALLKWSILFGVSESEERRNVEVEKYQNNRNPFIDHPEYAVYIWEDFNSTTQKIVNQYVSIYNVTFNTNGGSTLNTQEVLNNCKVNKPQDPTKKGATFLGWYLDSSLTKPFDFNTKVTGNMNLYAKWSNSSSGGEVIPQTYEVTFDTNGGSSVPKQIVQENDCLQTPQEPTKSGYEFEGWYLNSSLTQKYNFTTPVTSSFTLYAKWSKSTATVTKDITIDLTAQGYENGQNVITVSSSENEVTVNFDKGTNSLPSRYYNDGEAVRSYGGNTITISSESLIKNIEFVFGSSDGSNEIIASNGEFSSPNWTSGDEEINSTIFTIGGTSGHRRIRKIIITIIVDSDGEEGDPDLDLSTQDIMTKLSFSYKKSISSSNSSINFEGKHASITSGTDQNGCSYTNIDIVDNDISSFGLSSVTKAFKAYETDDTNNHIIKFGTSSAVGSLIFDNVRYKAEKITFKASGWKDGVKLNITNGEVEQITLTTSYSQYSIVVKDKTKDVTISSSTSVDRRFFLGNITFTEESTISYAFDNFLMRFKTTIEKDLFESVKGVSFGALINKATNNPKYEDMSNLEFDSLYTSSNKYLNIEIDENQIEESDQGYTLSAALTNIPLSALKDEVVAVFYIKTSDKVYFTSSKTYSVSSLTDEYLTNYTSTLSQEEIDVLNELDSYIG